MTVISLVQSNIIRSQSSACSEKSQRVKTNKAWVIILVFAILVSGLFYLFQVNSITAKGYKITAFKKQINDLEDKNKVLQISISDLKSINVLQMKSESFGMIKAQGIDYLAIPQANVTAAR